MVEEWSNGLGFDAPKRKSEGGGVNEVRDRGEEAKIPRGLRVDMPSAMVKRDDEEREGRRVEIQR